MSHNYHVSLPRIGRGYLCVRRKKMQEGKNGARPEFKMAEK